MGDDQRTAEEKRLDVLGAEIRRVRAETRQLRERLTAEKALDSELITRRKEVHDRAVQLRENAIPLATQRLINLQTYQRNQLSAIEGQSKAKREGTVPFVISSPVKRPASQRELTFDGAAAERRIALGHNIKEQLSASSAYQTLRSKEERKEHLKYFETQLRLVSKIEQRETLCSVGY